MSNILFANWFLSLIIDCSVRTFSYRRSLLYFIPETYCLAKLDNFQYAHKIIYEVKIEANEDELKACFLDSKREFY